jgi:hypothetical protein
LLCEPSFDVLQVLLSRAHILVQLLPDEHLQLWSWLYESHLQAVQIAELVQDRQQLINVDFFTNALQV